MDLMPQEPSPIRQDLLQALNILNVEVAGMTVHLRPLAVLQCALSVMNHIFISMTASASRAIRNQLPQHLSAHTPPPLLRANIAHFWIIFARKQGVRISLGAICP